MLLLLGSELQRLLDDIVRKLRLAPRPQAYLVVQEVAQIAIVRELVDDGSLDIHRGVGEDLLDDVGAVLLPRELCDAAEHTARDAVGVDLVAPLDEVLGGGGPRRPPG